MTNRRPILSTGEIYHIYNRTIGTEYAFNTNRNLCKFYDIVDFYRYKQPMRLSKFISLPIQNQQELILERKKNSPIVEIYSFAFMPNHFHFLIKQLNDNGISYFASNVQNSYAKYYNIIADRLGGLFQSNFKAKRITSSEEFIHVSRYIHLNPVTSRLIDFEQLKNYPWTSFFVYFNNKLNAFVSKEIIINHFKDIQHYTSFVKNQVEYQITLKQIKDHLFD